MGKKIKSVLVALVVLSCTLLTAPTVSAVSCGKDKDGNEVVTYFDWGCSGDEGITALAKAIFTIVSGLVAAGCLGAIVYGAIRYSAASSNAAAAKEGLDIIRNAVIALVLYGCFFAIVELLTGASKSTLGL